MRSVMAFAIILLFGCGGGTSEVNQESTKAFNKYSGDWTIESRIDDGKVVPAASLKGIQVEIREDTYSIKVGGTVVMDKWKWSLNTSAVPTTYDIPILGGPDKGKTMFGICETQGEISRYCDVVGNDSTQRPKEFSAGPGSGRRLFVYRRIRE